MQPRIFMSCFLLLLAGSVLGQEKNRWLTVEPNHSTIGFRVPISGGVTLVTGKFTDFDLELALVNEDWTQSEATFSIQAESINTGIPDRDQHLRSADFFDVEQYPTITFTSKTIKRIDDTHFEANGTFNMHGVSKAITLPFEILGYDGKSIGIQIRTQLNRLDYGVGSHFKHTTTPNFLAKEIEVEINFWTKRDKRKPKG
ncbi:MAG: YceI family protein [Saprospiraceae bacterium]|nr:YceI family protein [Saprospiraceae bacterium]